MWHNQIYRPKEQVVERSSGPEETCVVKGAVNSLEKLCIVKGAVKTLQEESCNSGNKYVLDTKKEQVKLLVACLEEVS